jgi:manganese/zinc/iron transport system permease protein
MLAALAYDANLRWVLGSVILLGICSGALGTVLILRKQGLLGDVLAHAALPGVALSFLLFQSRNSFILMFGAICSCALAYWFIQALTKTTKIKPDSSFAIVLSLFFAFGAGLITYIQKLPLGSQSGLDRLLFGQAGALVKADLQALALLSIVFLVFFIFAGRKLKELTFDRQFCLVQGVKSEAYDLILAILAVALIALSLQLVGAVMLAGLLIIPAAAARLWIKDFWQMVFVAALLGASSGAIGTLVSYNYVAQPTGPWIILLATAFFVISFIFAPDRGILSSYLRRRSFKLKVEKENILRSIYKELEEFHSGDISCAIDLSKILIHRGYSRTRLLYLLKDLRKSDLVNQTGNLVRLTKLGLERAIAITKGHRLWEAFLASGQELDPSLWHAEAEEVEHFLSAEQLEALSQKLQQPKSDPHGRVIPREDP